MVADWLFAQTSLFAVLEPVLLAHGIVTESEHRSHKAFSLASVQSFDLLSEVLDYLARQRAEGQSTLSMLARILDQMDDLPDDIGRRQKIVMRLVEGVREEINLCGRDLEERLRAWRAEGSPGGAATCEAMIADAQHPLKELLSEILQRPEVNLSA